MYGFPPSVCVTIVGLNVTRGRFPPAVAGHFIGEQSAAGERSEYEDIARKGTGEGEGKWIEEVGEERAQQGAGQHLPARQHGAHQQHGKQV